MLSILLESRIKTKDQVHMEPYDQAPLQSTFKAAKSGNYTFLEIRRGDVAFTRTLLSSKVGIFGLKDPTEK